MKIHTLDKTQTDESGRYIGSVDLSNWQGHIEIEPNLGTVTFDSLKASGHIWANYGSGIKAGEGIEAGGGIKAGEGIKAGWGILCQLGLKCTQRLSFKYGLYVGACIWLEATGEARQAICGKLDADPSHVKLGEVIEIGMPEQTIEIDCVKYSADQVRERIAELKPVQDK